MAARAVFLDRDGVLNVTAPEGEWVTDPDAMILLPGAAAALRRLNEAGWLAIVVTNQRGVDLGLMTEAELGEVHDRMRALLAAEGAHLDDLLYCPHAKDIGCPCRKPAPGMILEGARRHGVDVGASWMIGDRASDVRCGARAGARTIFLTAEGLHPLGDARPDHVCADLAAAVEIILG